MSDANTTARTARESLARALNALQADPKTPPELVALAAPIAQAMGALHQIESTGALAPHADVALNHVRTALGALQQQTSAHPAVAQAMEAVASSLGLAHSLWQMAQPRPAGVAPSPPRPGPASVPRPAVGAPIPPPPAFMNPPQAAPPPPAFMNPPQAAPPPPPFVNPPQPMAPPPPPPQQNFAPPPPAMPVGFAPTVAQNAPAFLQHAAQGHAAVPVIDSTAPPVEPMTSRAPGAPAVGNDLPAINADLGTHSTTNFYKGLSGNDIIDHGGLFVSTYMVPKIGTQVRLKVSLPGGYEFEANAIVAWSREQSDGGADAPPGFGAKFTQITPAARQLVYRYVRNREPLFHDDL